MKTLGGLHPSKNIDETGLGRTEVNLTKKRKTKDGNKEYRKRSACDQFMT